MEVALEEHKVKKKTRWGSVERSLNQHIVYVVNDAGEKVQAGYIGTHKGAKFCPLAGFPQELAKAVCDAIAEQRGGGTIKSAAAPAIPDETYVPDHEDDE